MVKKKVNQKLVHDGDTLDIPDDVKEYDITVDDQGFIYVTWLDDLDSN